MTWVACAAAAFLVGSASYGADVANCDKVGTDVRAAVEKEPKKVLVVVEDAMVANESCACEIVKAAILSSHADPELIRQIVLTATNVAPRMAAVIAECAAGIAPDHSKDVAKSVKQVIGVVPEAPPAGNDFTPVPADIRGVYLIQPAALPVLVNHTPPHHGVPQSPSEAKHKDD